VVPGYSRPAGAVTHRHQRVVHGLLLRMSPEPQIAAVGGVESRAAHQVLISAHGWDQYLSRRSCKRSRASPLTPVPGRELRPGKPVFYLTIGRGRRLPRQSRAPSQISTPWVESYA